MKSKRKIVIIIVAVIGIISIGIGISIKIFKQKNNNENSTMNIQINDEVYKTGLLKEDSIMYLEANQESEEIITLEKETKVEVLSDEAILGTDNNQYLLVKDENATEGYILYDNIELIDAEKPEEEIKITKIEIEEKQLEVLKGDTKKIKYTYITDKEETEDDKNNLKVIFKSEDEDIATVDEEGVISTVNSGKTKIFVSNEDNTVKEEINITVREKAIKVTGISSTLTNIIMGIGEKYAPIYKILPINATNKEIGLTSKNKKIAVIQNNQIQGKSLGDTTVVLQTKDGNKKLSYNVKVKNAPSAITLNTTNITLNIGETFDLDSYAVNGGAMNRNYSSSNENIVSMKNSILVAKQTGTAIVTVQTYNGKKATCKVKVTNTKVDSSKNIMPYKYMVVLGATKQLNTTLQGQINWKSSNSKVVTISKTGLVTAKAYGTATITATNPNGQMQSAIFQVYDHKVSTITATTKEINIGLGESWALNEYKIAPTTAINQNISLKTTDNKVVAVSGKNIIGKKIGTAIITLVTEDGNKKTTIKVNVKPAPKSISLNYKNITMNSLDDTYDLDTYLTDGSASRLRKITVKDPNIVSIKSSILIPKKIGSTEVTVETYNGKKATCKVTVASMNKNGKLLYPANVSTRITYNNNLTSTLSGTITWISSNNKIATVQNGVVDSIKAGTVTITAKSNNGQIQTAKVDVPKVYPTSIKVDKTNMKFKLNNYKLEDEYSNHRPISATLNYTYTPNYANVDPTLTYKKVKYNDEVNISQNKFLTAKISVRGYYGTKGIIIAKVGNVTAKTNLNIGYYIEGINLGNTGDKYNGEEENLYHNLELLSKLKGNKYKSAFEYTDKEDYNFLNLPKMTFKVTRQSKYTSINKNGILRVAKKLDGVGVYGIKIEAKDTLNNYKTELQYNAYSISKIKLNCPTSLKIKKSWEYSFNEAINYLACTNVQCNEPGVGYITFKSSNVSIAKVYNFNVNDIKNPRVNQLYGYIQGLKPGTVTITGTSPTGLKASCKVRIVK